MNRSTMLAVLAVLGMILGIGSVAQATLVTYYIVDHPAFQADAINATQTDHVSGTIIADPDTDVISSASFTLWNGTTGPYTVASAVVVSGYYVHISPTEITIDRDNPTNSLGFGFLQLKQVGTAYPLEDVQWYLKGDPWVPGSMNYDGYNAEYKTSKSSVLLQFAAGSIGDSIVIAQVPEPGMLSLLALGVLAAIRRRHR